MCEIAKIKYVSKIDQKFIIFNSIRKEEHSPLKLSSMEIHFILVEPAVPENIGASARALKTMGFGNLRLVNPVAYRKGKALWLAHGSHDILENAREFISLEEAVADLDLVIGTTAKQRSVKYDYYSISELSKLIDEKGTTVEKAGLVFGREESGLTNNEMLLCNLITTIPMQTKYPSINLAQAVMIYAYTLSDIRWEKSNKPIPARDEHSFRKLTSNIIELLDNLSIPNGSPKHNRIIERINALGEKDINLMHSITRKVLDRLS